MSTGHTNLGDTLNRRIYLLLVYPYTLAHTGNMLYSERKRLADIALRESDGENLWSLRIPTAFRRKLLELIFNMGEVVNYYDSPIYSNGTERILSIARSIILRDTGRGALAGGRTTDQDMQMHIMEGASEDYPDILEALIQALTSLLSNYAQGSAEVKSFEASINKLLESYRIAYSLEHGEVIPFKSRELHTSIVLPALRLLTQQGWESVEESYQDSLKELVGGKPDNAITDATTALQEALRKVGCKGANLASLLKSALSA